jgi:hypothetical protein
MPRQTKAQVRAQWMSEFSDGIKAVRPDHVGYIDWNSAVYHFLSGFSPADAVASYLSIPR